MRAWLRRWLDLEPRGTLTLLPDGGLVLGLPGDPTMAEADRITMLLREWRANPNRPLVLPFALEVFDRRKP